MAYQGGIIGFVGGLRESSGARKQYNAGTRERVSGGASVPPPSRIARFGAGSERNTMQEGVYVISVAARILDMHPQTLRKYERVGLIMPSRTLGMSRLYSDEDIARLKLIKHLVENMGLNLAGVRMAMQLFNRMIEMRASMSHLEGQALRDALNHHLDEMLRTLSR